MAGYGSYLFLKSRYIPVTFPVCELSQKKIVNRFNVPFQEEVLLKDYFFYGETLNLKEDIYSIFSADEITGKTAILRNVCQDNNDSVYIMEKKIDRQIALENLDDGFYEVFLQDNLINYRAYFDEVLNETFYTIRRNGEVKEIELIANKNLFDDIKNIDILNKNYLFIKVTTKEPLEAFYDVVINPAYLDTDNDWSLDYSAHTSIIKAAEAIYDLAVSLKIELESYGLKVLLTRDNGEEILTYGELGRLKRGYYAHGKYFIDLRFNSSSNSATDGYEIIYSSWTSVSMASIISEQLRMNTNLKPLESGRYSGISNYGLSNGYEANLFIRENGGKALGAATYSSYSAENASFALDNRFGMQAISIRYGYLSNDIFANSLKEAGPIYIKETAKALAHYLSIEK